MVAAIPLLVKHCWKLVAPLTVTIRLLYDDATTCAAVLLVIGKVEGLLVVMVAEI